jgi:predicted nucleic acid-binding protein
VTAVIADTDILSTFGKIGRLDLLQRLFDKVHMAPAVSRELSRAAQMGFIWVASVQPVAMMLPLTVEESREVERLTNLYPQLGSGEIESIVLAQTHHLTCLTNDRQAKTVAQALGLSYLDLEEILRALKTRTVLTTTALTALIAQIEEHDRTHIKAKAQILSD